MSGADSASFITDEMRGLLGKTMRTATSYPISASDIAKWAVAVYFPHPPPRLYWDEEYARGSCWKGIVAPLEFNPIAASWIPKDAVPPPEPSLAPSARAGDFELSLGVTPPPYRAVLQSRVIATYSGARMRPGDVVRCDTSISEYFERRGRFGLQLYTTVSGNYYHQNGEWIKRLDTVFLRYQ